MERRIILIGVNQKKLLQRNKIYELEYYNK